MSDQLSFEAFDACIVAAVKATEIYKLEAKGAQQQEEPRKGKENIEKNINSKTKSFLTIKSFAHISNLSQESIHVQAETVDTDIHSTVAAVNETTYDEECKKKELFQVDEHT